METVPPGQGGVGVWNMHETFAKQRLEREEVPTRSARTFFSRPPITILVPGITDGLMVLPERSGYYGLVVMSVSNAKRHEGRAREETKRYTKEGKRNG